MALRHALVARGSADARPRGAPADGMVPRCIQWPGMEDFLVESEVLRKAAGADESKPKPLFHHFLYFLFFYSFSDILI